MQRSSPVLDRLEHFARLTYCTASEVLQLRPFAPQLLGLMLQVDPVALLETAYPREVLLGVMFAARGVQILCVAGVPAGVDVTDLGARRLIPG